MSNSLGGPVFASHKAIAFHKVVTLQLVLYYKESGSDSGIGFQVSPAPRGRSNATHRSSQVGCAAELPQAFSQPFKKMSSAKSSKLATNA